MPQAQRIVHMDTNDVRVTEWRLGPGTSTGSHKHFCDCVMVPLTSGLMRVAGASDQRIVEVTPGRAILWAAPEERDASNDGTDHITFVEIELKNSVRRLISG
jgi:hypothetical protein